MQASHVRHYEIRALLATHGQPRLQGSQQLPRTRCNPSRLREEATREAVPNFSLERAPPKPVLTSRLLELVTMDILGSLPKSKSEKQFVVVKEDR